MREKHRPMTAAPHGGWVGIGGRSASRQSAECDGVIVMISCAKLRNRLHFCKLNRNFYFFKFQLSTTATG